MLTQPKLLRRPLPPKSRPKPPPKKEKIQSAVTNEVSKENLESRSRKIIYPEKEKNVSFGKSSVKKRQNRVHIKNLILTWCVKENLDTAPKIISKKQPDIYLLFSNIKDDFAGSASLPTSSVMKEESVISEESSEQRKMRSLSVYSPLGKSSAISSDTPTPTSSQLGHSSSFLKTDLEHVTTPDSAYIHYSSSSMFEQETGTLSNKTIKNWYDKIQISCGTLSHQMLSIDLPSTILPRKPYRQHVIELLATQQEKQKCIEKFKPIELESHCSELSSAITESDEELVVCGEGVIDESRRQDPKMYFATMAVLKCCAHGRNALNFKGFFISRCPDLAVLANQLVYINLSFNNLHTFPKEVLIVRKLQVLKMRNNPIREISSDIHILKYLRIFVISFNLLTSLPKGLFKLSQLEFLDISYNELYSIPNDIQYLRSLSIFHVDGNELTSMPPGLLKLYLDNLTVDNNFMHPLMWKENSTNDAQRLIDLALLSFSKNHLWKFYPSLSYEIKQQLISSTLCDYCQGPMFGKGLRIIRPFDIFNISFLPVMFQVCSTKCYKKTKRDSHILERLGRKY